MNSPNFNLRIPLGDREKWQAAADRDRRSLSDWIKIACDEKLARSRRKRSAR